MSGAINSLLKPLHNFTFDPPNPALAKLDPLGELTGRLKAGDVLWAIEYDLPKLTL